MDFCCRSCRIFIKWSVRMVPSGTIRILVSVKGDLVEIFNEMFVRIGIGRFVIQCSCSADSIGYSRRVSHRREFDLLEES